MDTDLELANQTLINFFVLLAFLAHFACQRPMNEDCQHIHQDGKQLTKYHTMHNWKIKKYYYVLLLLLNQSIHWWGNIFTAFINNIALWNGLLWGNSFPGLSNIVSCEPAHHWQLDFSKQQLEPSLTNQNHNFHITRISLIKTWNYSYEVDTFLILEIVQHSKTFLLPNNTRLTWANPNTGVFIFHT